MYMIFYRWNSKLRPAPRKEHIEWTAQGELWMSEKAATDYITILSNEAGKWQFQWKVMKLSDLDPVTVYERIAQGAALQIGE